MLSDVTSTFLDAARIFGSQKGAGPADVELLERRLRQLAGSYPRNPVGVPRTGAAGGLSGGLWAHFGAALVSGADAVLDAAQFVGSVAADLGEYARNFSEILVAPDADAMYTAGKALAGYSALL